MSPKRKYIGLPAWLDYLVQFLWFSDRVIIRLAPDPAAWACWILDRYCQCDKCLERRDRWQKATVK